MAITDEFPTGHASLSDGTTTIPFIFTDGQGKKNERAFTAAPYPRQALKTITGESKYSDLEPPYFAIAQDDFTGGRGNEDFESDTSRYFDGHWLDTTKEAGIVLGGRESYGTGYQNTDQAMPGSMVFQGVYNAPRRYLAVSFEASATYTTYQCEIWLKGIDSPTYDLQVELWSNHASNYPSAMLASKTITAANITSDTLSILINFIWTGSPNITDGVTYWVVIDGGDSATSTRHWAIGCDAATAGKKKAEAGSWSATTYSPYFRITPAANTWDYVTFFEYKRGLYMFTRDDNADSKLYINGDRGACDINSPLSTLVDATKSWVTNEWEGCYVILLHPTGTQEGTTWRLISSNTATALTVTPDWTIVHTTSDDYVIVGSDKWTLVRTLAKIRDFTIGNDVVYFSCQDNSGMTRYRAYNNSSGVWTEEEIKISNDSDYLQYIKPPGDIHGYLHCVKGQSSASIFNRQQYYFKSQIPIEPSASYFLEQVVAPLGSHRNYWEGKLGSNLTIRPGEASAAFTIADAHVTGIIAVQNFDTPLDLTRGRRISFDAESDVGCSSGDFQFCFSDVEGLEQSWLPDKVLKEDYSTTWSPDKVFYENNYRYDAPTYVGLEADFDGTPAFTEWTNTSDEDSATQTTVSITTDDYLWIGYSERFDTIAFDLGTVNAVDTPMTLSYFNGSAWAAPDNISDGTLTGTTPLTKDGSITFDKPSDDQWLSFTRNSIEAYWIRIRHASDDLTPDMNFKRMYFLMNSGTSSDKEYLDLKNVYDGDVASGETIEFRTEDFLHIGNGTKFNKITVDIGKANDIASVMTGSYWNGSVWTAVTIVDGTNPSSPSDGDTLKQDGTITFTIPTDWEANTVNGSEAYWIRLDVSVALVTNFRIQEITVTADDANAPKTYTDMTNAYDGHVATDHDLKLAVADYLYVGNGNKFNKITFDFGTVATENGAATAAYWNGSVWTAVTITLDGTAVSTNTFHQDGTITFTIPYDWKANTVNGTEAYWIRLDVATALTTIFSINEITVTFDAYHKVGFIAMTANVWEHYSPVINRHLTNIDWTSIKSIGIYLGADKGANVLDIKNFQITDNGNEDKRLLGTSYPTKGIVEYVGNVDDPVNNPWIITEEGVFEVQTQNDDQIVPLPLEEISAFKSEDTGFAATVNGNYLYFNLGKRLERYFNRTLDDIGPDRDAGLPANRQGYPSTLVSYPGRVFAGIDAQTAGYSSVLVLKGSSWHEVYRAPRVGMRIRDAIIHTIPDTDVHHLWVSMGDDVVKVPINLNPYYESDFKFTHEGHLITSYIYANLLDVQKTWKSLKIFAENVTTTRNIVADYQTEGSSTWIEIGTFDTVPVEEIDIASTFPQAKRIRYRLRFFTNDQAETPRMKAIVTEGVAFVPVKYQYSWTFAIKKTTEGIGLTGAWNATLTSVQQYDQLVTWANAGTQLTLLHHSNVYNNKTVFMDPVSVSPFRVVDDQDIENHVASLTCFEV